MVGTRALSMTVPTAPPLSGAPVESRPRSNSLPDISGGAAQRLIALKSQHPAEHRQTFQRSMSLSERPMGAQALPGTQDEPVQSILAGVDDGIGASELNDALQAASGGVASAMNGQTQAAGAFSVDDALDFRLNHFDAAILLADELMMRVGLLMEKTQDRGLLAKLTNVLKGLDQFKENVKSEKAADQKRAEGLREDERKATDASQRYRAARQLLGGTVKKPFGGKTWLKFKLFDGLVARFQQASVRRAGARGDALRLPGSPLHLRTSLATHLSGLMKATGLEGCSARALQKDLGVRSAQCAERDLKWEAIRNDIKLKSPEGEDRVFTNRQVPARELSRDIAQAYGADRRGVSCMNTVEDKHVVNLWKTEFATPGNPPLAFSALRHGVHDAYGLKQDPVAREQAADARVQEFVKAAALSDPSRLVPTGQADEAGLPIVEVPIVSVSLLSPAPFGGERSMWQQQRDAYARANAGEGFVQRLDLGDGQGLREVRLRPSVIAFSTPVNTFALESGALLRSALGGWEDSDRANGPALDALLGPAGGPPGGLAANRLAALRAERDRLAGLSERSADQEARLQALEGKILRADVLMVQIRKIVDAPRGSDLSHHRAGQEPYKLPVRLVALANELGLTGAFNCKSGKDRTGQLDVEVKAFYAAMSMSPKGGPPEPEQTPSPTHLANRARLFNEAGSFEIQKYNTTMPGSKLNVEVVKKQLKQAMRAELPPEQSGQAGRHVIKEHIKGLSGWVGS
jgi:phosphatidylinositol-4,5-bisphosphate 4-phosphatase